MLRTTALIVGFILLLLLPAVAIGPLDIKEKRKELKEELVQGGSDAFRSIKEHVHEMKEDLKDSLREKGVEFKKGAIEGESDARHDAYPHMPSVDEKLNEAAHDTGYFAGAAKEKLAKAGEKISEAATDAKESLKGKARNAADTAKETVHIAQDKLNDAELAAKTKAEDAKERLQETRYNAKVSLDETKQRFKESVAGAKDSAERTKDSLKESLKEAGQKAKEGLNYATEKVKEGAESVKEDAEDLIGHAKWKAEYAARKAESVAKEHFNRLQDELKAEGHHIGHGAERIKDAGANVKQEVKREAEELKEDAKGVWGWLKGVFSGTTHSIATKLKEEEAHTKSSLARQLHKAADAKEEEANRARMEYEAMLARVYGADEAAKEVHRKLRSEQLQMKHAAELAAEKARAAKESFLESAAEFKHKAGDKLEEVKEKAKLLAHEAKERAAETMRGTAESELAAECAATEEHIVQEAKSLAEADLKHQHGCDLKQEARLAEELRKAKEQREYITETDNRPPMHTHHGVGDSIRRAFRALNPLAMFA